MPVVVPLPPQPLARVGIPALKLGLVLGLMSGLMLGLGSASVAAQQRLDPLPTGPRVTPVVRVVHAVGPAVVNVYQEVPDEQRLPFPYRQLWDEQRSTSTSLGSGFVIDPDGWILTNAHVLEDESAPIRVRFSDGSEEPAELVNVDERNDVALLRVHAGRRLPAAPLGTSSDLLVGETVIAIGNPLGNENTVTTGIVSGLFRDVHVPGDGRQRRGGFRDYVQIDAPINPGNSGGPLLNVLGEVVGINFAIKTDAEGIGFAIPIDRVRRSLIDVLSDPRQQNDLVTGVKVAGDRRGRDPVVTRVDPQSPAERAGLRVGDRVLAVREGPVRWEFDFNKALLGARPGDRVDVTVVRGEAASGTEITLTLDVEQDESARSHLWRALGLRLEDHSVYYGVTIAAIDPLGPAAGGTLRGGDLLDTLDGEAVDSIEDLSDLLRRRPAGGRAVLQGFRGERGFRAALHLAAGD